MRKKRKRKTQKTPDTIQNPTNLLKNTHTTEANEEPISINYDNVFSNYSEEEKGTETDYGSFPPPSLLIEYNKIVKNAAERIFKMAEKQQDAESKLERDLFEADIVYTSRSQIFGLIVALSGFLLVGYGFYSGHELGPALIGSIEIASLVFIFIKGRSTDNEDD